MAGKPIDRKALKGYIQNGMNVMLIGEPGTGKTTVIKDICEELGLKMKYDHASTMDVQIQFIGVPVPLMDEQRLKFMRPDAVSEAEVLFIDEMNRADPRIRNTLLELVQFKSINGDPLPNLKCVITAVNPATGNNDVEDMDEALIDRFDAFIEVDARIDVPYFTKRFNVAVAKAAEKWWNIEHDIYLKAKKNTKNPPVYLSPRRMEKMVAAYIAMPTISTLNCTKPYGSTCNLRTLKTSLDAALKSVDSGDQLEESTLNVLLMNNVADLSNHVDLLKEALESSTETVDNKNKILTHVAGLLNRNIAVAKIVELYGFVVEEMTPTQFSILTAGWSDYKTKEMAKLRTKRYAI